MVADLRSGLVLAAVIAWRQMLTLGPYVLAGMVLAALLGQFHPPLRGLKGLNHARPTTVLSAASLGCLSPLTTFGTVPTLLRLVQEGVSPGPALAFLSASSMLSPQVFLLILGGLGPRPAFSQLVGIILLSGLAGWAISRFPPASVLHPAIFPTGPPAERSPSRFSWSRLGRDLVGLLGWIGFTFLIGVILSSLLQVFIPIRWITGLLESGRWTAIVLAGIAGVPLYFCGGSAVPVLAFLLQAGMSPGAAVAFLISGAATRATALAAVGSLLNPRALAVYVLYVVVGAIAVGLLLG